ncbi:hypothetical protein [Mesorhizobium huakuii]|uniref:Uncharacterized protein n=1 Tax=Mesorhizobium huakuii TaxID=28104 RepID=A0ABZ0VZB6_9HYPH|nr:hypothetical protein [Mesorhizobium huakuii]WQC02741.1 hypothetical protein U0R22_006996 [Mesorhizobium huakuii]
MSHTKGASIDNAILRAFRRAISEKKIPESQWRDFAAQIIREFTGFDTVDPDLLDWIACKSEHARPKPPKFLDHKLECPYCLTIRLRIPTELAQTPRFFAMIVERIWAPGMNSKPILRDRAVTMASSA